MRRALSARARAILAKRSPTAARAGAVTVVAARSANPLKVRQIAALGATVQLEGEDIEDARMLAREIAQAHGA